MDAPTACPESDWLRARSAVATVEALPSLVAPALPVRYDKALRRGAKTRH